jgi:hypothetical protein
MSDGKTAELLSSALNSLGALIEAEESKGAGEGNVESPSSSSPSFRARVSHGYTRTTASWENRYVASETEREYRRDQSEKLQENISVAWVSPKSSPRRLQKNDLFSLENTPNGQFVPMSSRCSSIHSQNLSATMLSSPNRGSSSRPRELVASTKSVTDSWGSQWGLRGSSPAPTVNEQTVYSAMAKRSFDGVSKPNKSKLSHFSVGVNLQSKIIDHTKNWIMKRREILQQRKSAPVASEFVGEFRMKSKVKKKRLRAAKSSFQTAMETRKLHSKIEENEIALHQLVSSLPAAYRKIVERQIHSGRSEDPTDRLGSDSAQEEKNPSAFCKDDSIEVKTKTGSRHIFNDNAHRAHLHRQKAAREITSGVRVMGDNWTNSPTKFAPFKLSVSKKKKRISGKKNTSRSASEKPRRKKKKVKGAKKKANGKVKTKKKKVNSSKADLTTS